MGLGRKRGLSVQGPHVDTHTHFFSAHIAPHPLIHSQRCLLFTTVILLFSATSLEKKHLKLNFKTKNLKLIYLQVL